MKSDTRRRITVVDTHTAGEPTRVVVAGGPDLGVGTLAERRARFQRECDAFRSAIAMEPRGSDVLVGALVCEPADSTCAAAVIFFNNVGYLGMCGHGTIGLVAALAHLGRLQPGVHRIETPAGVVAATLHEDGSVSVANVPSYRMRRGLTVEIPGVGRVTGDVAWGGNWFFLSEAPPDTLGLEHVDWLTDYSWRVRQVVNARGFPEVDHVELFGPATRPEARARNFVLCPGKAYDRSPCGTGTSAKLACLAADGQLAENEPWVQESIVGTTFSACYQRLDDQRILPTITGTAFVNAEATLLLDPADPFCWGIRP